MTAINFSKYQGTGNDFILIDKRKMELNWDIHIIKKLCDRKFGIGADGLIFIEDDPSLDFYMQYYNADGNQASLCGNGGRCAVDFAKKLKIISSNKVCFRAIDGIHKAIIEKNKISLEILDVKEIIKEEDKGAIFLDTGSPHVVKFLNNLDKIDVYKQGRAIRYNPLYKEKGVNVNFVEILSHDTIKIRTYERGVENETLSCGTGVSAAAIVSYEMKKINTTNIFIETKGGPLEVSFHKEKGVYKKIWLSGEVGFVFKGSIKI